MGTQEYNDKLCYIWYFFTLYYHNLDSLSHNLNSHLQVFLFLCMHIYFFLFQTEIGFHTCDSYLKTNSVGSLPNVTHVMCFFKREYWLIYFLTTTTNTNNAVSLTACIIVHHLCIMIHIFHAQVFECLQ